MFKENLTRFKVVSFVLFCFYKAMNDLWKAAQTTSQKYYQVYKIFTKKRNKRGLNEIINKYMTFAGKES